MNKKARKSEYHIKPDESSKFLFEEVLAAAFKEQINKYLNKDNPEPLAHLEYEQELLLKWKALNDFWKMNELPCFPEKIIASPKPRKYRTTTKRKVVSQKNKFVLVFSEFLDWVNPISMLEPDEHSQIYSYLHDRINDKHYRIIGECANYFIVRGSYSEFTVIFNMNKLSPAVINKLKEISGELKKLGINIISSFVYFDPTKSGYYLESTKPAGSTQLKKLFGPEKLFLKLAGKKYSYSPVSFSQINESILPGLIEKIKLLLDPKREEKLIDLYCGYGLFSLFFAANYSEITGIDHEGFSIQSAIENLNYFKSSSRIKFIAKRINAESLRSILNYQAAKPEIFILDPPRLGTEPGVIETISRRHPLKVLHIFCGINRIPNELKEWKRNGYQANKIVVLDMFPGTLGLEVLILLKPSMN